MGCGCKKKHIIPPQPAQPVPTTEPTKVVLKENIPPSIHPPKSFRSPQDEINRIVEKLNSIRFSEQ